MVGQVMNNSSTLEEEMPKRKSSFNIEEVKVRWKKAALENCPGIPCILPFTCGTSTIVDIDGNTYNTVLIGAQCWTKENLKVTRYNNDTPIYLENLGGTIGSSTTWQNLVTGAYAIYANQSTTDPNASNYGFLYNWYAVADNRKICPAGWRVPTDVEWTTLIQYIDPNAGALISMTGTQSNIAGGILKSTSALWTSPNTSANIDPNSFSALPGGYRFYEGSFISIRNDAYFWSNSQFPSSTFAWYRSLNYNNSVVLKGISDKSNGMSVRCLRD